MATLNSEIIITEQLRPCLVNGKKALFHKWVELAKPVPPSFINNRDCGGQLTTPYGIIELEDGQCTFANVNDIKFIPLNFNDYAFNTEVENEIKSQ